jgi:hypothetical protein
MAFTCTPSELLKLNPCLPCLSEKELLAALVGIFAAVEEHEVAEVMRNSACFTCMSKKQLLVGLVSLMGQGLLDRQTVPEIIDDIRCLECASEKQLLAAIMWLLCHDFEDWINPA